MLDNNLLETSISLSFLRKLHKSYNYIIEGFNELCKNSQTQNVFQNLYNKLKIWIKFSFLGRIIEPKAHGDYDLFDASFAIQWIKTLYEKWKLKFNSYIKISRTNITIRQLKNGMFLLPIKSLSVILIISILTNIIISILLKIEIGLLGCIIRGLLFFVAICGLNSQIDWSAVKSSSLFLRLFIRKCAGSAEK